MEPLLLTAYLAHAIKAPMHRKKYWMEQSCHIHELFERFRIPLSQKSFEHFQERIWPHIQQWNLLPQHRCISWYDHDYPPLLKHIIDSPVLIYIRGHWDPFQKPMIAIVGSRECSSEGQSITHEMASALSRKGWTIVSGMALGIDAEAHRGTLKVPGSTIGVLGTGIDSIYPSSHKPLAENIIQQHGALLSDFSLGTRAQAWHFPHRNRLISGLSHGVLVIEAKEKSGSLITARLAMEQGRPVFAIPGSTRSNYSKGCHELIKQGVQLVETAEEIHEAFPWNPTLSQPSMAEEISFLDPSEQLIWNFLSKNITSFDTLMAQSGLTAEKVCSILLGMELRGIVLASVGGYQRCTS